MTYALATGSTLRILASSNITYTVFGDEITTTDAFKKLAQGLGTGANVLVYTVPAATQTIVKAISLANSAGTPALFLIYVDGSAATNLLFSVTVPANGSATYDGQWRVYDLNGIALTASTPISATGDATGTQSGSNLPLTLATVNGAPGTFGSATQVSQVTVNAKGLATTVASVSIQIAESQVTNLVTDLAGKQPTGNYITALTGDGTATGPGSVAFTLATVNGAPGTFGSATQVSQVTVNGKGLATTVASVSIQIAESQVTNLVTDLAGKQPTGNYITALTGDATATGPGSVAITLATVNGAPGTFGSATQVAQVTVNGKGLATTVASVSIQIAESQVTNLVTDLAAKVATVGATNFKPKDIEGNVWIDPSNTQGWAGADVGAWVNAAYAYITTNWWNSGTQVGGGTINFAPGNYNQTTPIVANTAGLSIIFRGAGDGWGATTITWTPTSGTAWTIGGGGSNAGGVQVENITITGGFPVNTGSTGMNIAGSGGTMKNAAIVRFGQGVAWLSASGAYGWCFMNCKFEFNTTGCSPLGENNVFVGGLFAGNGTAINLTLAGGSEVQAFGVAFDDNTVTAFNIGNVNARASLDGCRFENAGNGTPLYITQSAGSLSMVSGAFQDDVTTGTATTFVSQTGGVAKYDGVWHGLSRAMTSCYTPASPASITVINPIVAPGSAAAGLAVLNWLPSAYSMASEVAVATSGTGETIIARRIVPLNTLDIGSSFRWAAHGTQVTANTSLIWRMHFGPNGSAADPIVAATVAVAVATAAGAYTHGACTVRTCGATGTIIGNAFSQGTTSTSSVTTAAVLANSTQTNFLTLTATAAAGVCTVQNAYIELLQPN